MASEKGPTTVTISLLEAGGFEALAALVSRILKPAAKCCEEFAHARR